MINPHIKCNVNTCKHNHQAKNCNLDTITVGNTTTNPNEKRETECGSFESCCN